MPGWLYSFLTWGGAGPATILISATIALLVAYVARLTQRRVARQQQTIQMLMNSLWDEDFIKDWRLFNRIIGDQNQVMKDMEKWSIGRDKRRRGEWQALTAAERTEIEEADTKVAVVRQCLNHYELVSIGIREGIYDEKIYRRWYNQSVIRDWVATRVVIDLFRKDISKESGFASANRLFAEFDEMARLWSAGEVKRPKLRSVPLGNGRKLTFRFSR